MEKWIKKVVPKIKYYDNRIYCGYLTPKEICLMLDSNFIKPDRENDLQTVSDFKTLGKYKPMWYYFRIIKGTDFSRLVGERLGKHTD